MYYLVQKAKDTPNISKLPPEWPVEADPCSKDAVVPEGWEKLTQEELDTLKADNMKAYEKWDAKRKAKEAKEKEKEKEEIEAPARRAQAKLKDLDFKTDEIRAIMGVNYVE